MNIRNFAIIAHIDHGKSTLADRLLEITGLVQVGSHDEQMLDANPISRERGITIKLAPVTMNYIHGDNQYILHLIDTPGHVDFAYEVDRTLSCVEGALLLVDATQGIQAQTISNAYKAIEKNLTIIPVINKIDLPSADVPKTMTALKDFLGVQENDIMKISAKTGENVVRLLQEIIHKIPPAKTNTKKELQMLLFDSYYDSHRGVIAFGRIFGGTVKKGNKVILNASGAVFDVSEVGSFSPTLVPKESLSEGEIGYIVTGLKDIRLVRVGDTITTVKDSAESVTGYKQVKPMVYASLFTTDPSDYENLKKALEKLTLNDAALQYTAIYSTTLGAGFKVGFLGLLHADVVRERLEVEYDLDLVITPPTTEFLYSNGVWQEPIAKILIVTPQDYVGGIMKLTEEYRGHFITMNNEHQTQLTYELPMSELISDYFDKLKSISSGYASLDWELVRYETVSADKMELLINGDAIEEFSEIVVRERAYEKGSELCSKLKELIPRQQFDVKIQAKFQGKIIASTALSAYRKDVLVKSGKNLGSGDVGRRKMLLERQKEGKKKMKMIGKVEVPKEAFLKLFKKS